MRNLWQLVISAILVAGIIVAIVRARRRSARLRREQREYLDTALRRQAERER